MFAFGLAGFVWSRKRNRQLRSLYKPVNSSQVELTGSFGSGKFQPIDDSAVIEDDHSSRGMDQNYAFSQHSSLTSSSRSGGSVRFGTTSSMPDRLDSETGSGQRGNLMSFMDTEMAHEQARKSRSSRKSRRRGAFESGGSRLTI